MLKQTSGGSSERLTNDPIVIPQGPSFAANVITVTTVGTCLIPRRNDSASTGTIGLLLKMAFS